ncbi:MAG: hypothetical protein HQL51_00015 [Magnetococcales bacterium]|nr:hypothetical protein [Magnetococcales bacterium]
MDEGRERKAGSGMEGCGGRPEDMKGHPEGDEKDQGPGESTERGDKLKAKDFAKLVEQAVTHVEEMLGVKIACDDVVLEEVIRKTLMAINVYKGVYHLKKPSCGKKSALLTYNIARYKPLRLISYQDELAGLESWLQREPAQTDPVMRQAEAQCVGTIRELFQDPPGNDSLGSLRLFLNEFVAAIVGLGLTENLLSTHKVRYRVELSPELLHDLVTGLRYFEFSPQSLALIFLAAARRESQGPTDPGIEPERDAAASEFMASVEAMSDEEYDRFFQEKTKTFKVAAQSLGKEDPQ